jgi:microsomal dipeptidase-like Zn-dependent dipeptidase
MCGSMEDAAELTRRRFLRGTLGAALDDYADLPAVADLLLKQGFSPAKASKLLGGNYMRVFRQAVAARRA